MKKLSITELYAKENRGWLRFSVHIAAEVIEAAERLKWGKNTLAEKLQWKVEDVEILYKGQYNLKLSQIALLERILGITLIEFATN